ncbi:MAG: hypothetical protein IPM78_11005 [Moraxellaceae bacterium]|nr:hypothetical protein [Moraxellaceae bacterium]
MPAWGESHFRHEKVYGLDQQADRVADWARQILPRKAHFVGSSMGAALRVWWRRVMPMLPQV